MQKNCSVDKDFPQSYQIKCNRVVTTHLCVLWSSRLSSIADRIRTEILKAFLSEDKQTK